MSATGVRDAAAPPRRVGAAGPELRSRCAGELSSVPRAEWDALITPGSVPLRHAYLQAWEHSELRGLCSRPVLSYAAGSEAPVAACPGYFYDLDVPTVRLPQTAAAVNVIRRVLPGFLYARTYELGSPTPLTNPFLVARPELRPLAVPTLIDAGVGEGEAGDADLILVQNFTSRSGPAAEELGARGFAGVAIPPTAVVNLPFASFDEYLGAMRAQYRRRAQQTLKRSRSLTVEHLMDFRGEAEELARLWRAIYERAREVKREVLTPAFFHAVAELPEASVLLMRRDDGTIASFGLLLDDSPWLSFLQCGFEADAGRREGAYFRLLLEIIRYAIERGYEQVDLGLTTLEPKLDVGAVPVPLFAWLRHRNALFQRVILALADGPLSPPLTEARRVFKEAPPAASELVERRRLLV